MRLNASVNTFYFNIIKRVFSFSKSGGAEFLPHLGLIETLHKSFLRSGLPFVYTEGFNPLPRLELAASLSIGITSDEEIASCLLEESVEGDTFAAALGRALPGYIRVKEACIFPVTRQIKRESLASLLWGSEYRFSFRSGYELPHGETPEFLQYTQQYRIEGDELTAMVPFGGDRKLRDGIAEFFGKPLYECAGIHKVKTFAAVPEAYALPGESGAARVTGFFELYRRIAERNRAIWGTGNLFSVEKNV